MHKKISLCNTPPPENNLPLPKCSRLSLQCTIAYSLVMFPSTSMEESTLLQDAIHFSAVLSWEGMLQKNMYVVSLQPTDGAGDGCMLVTWQVALLYPVREAVVFQRCPL